MTFSSARPVSRVQTQPTANACCVGRHRRTGPRVGGELAYRIAVAARLRLDHDASHPVSAADDRPRGDAVHRRAALDPQLGRPLVSAVPLFRTAAHHQLCRRRRDRHHHGAGLRHPLRPVLRSLRSVFRPGSRLRDDHRLHVRGRVHRADDLRLGQDQPADAPVRDIQRGTLVQPVRALDTGGELLDADADRGHAPSRRVRRQGLVARHHQPRRHLRLSAHAGRLVRGGARLRRRRVGLLPAEAAPRGDVPTLAEGRGAGAAGRGTAAGLAR